jgi:hypothetical protein
MKKLSLTFIVALLAVFVLAACGGGGGAADVQKAVCEAIGGLKTATSDLTAINAETTVKDLKAAKVRIDDTVNLVKTANSALNLEQVTKLLASYDEVSKTIDGISGDTTIGPAAEQVQAGVAKLSAALDEANSTLKCGQ